MVLFDCSWYNRPGVERVMGFATDDEVECFFKSCPDFERLLVRSGATLIKYWFSVSAQEQERRFMDRMENKEKRWKLSPMDLESRLRWNDYSRAKDEMLARTDSDETPWFVIEADSKRRARLNCIRHLLEQIPYEDLTQEKMPLPPRDGGDGDYVRPPIEEQRAVTDYYADN
jgi:polyphosphate kinase 2 (PPK2 family)